MTFYIAETDHVYYFIYQLMSLDITSGELRKILEQGEAKKNLLFGAQLNIIW